MFRFSGNSHNWSKNANLDVDVPDTGQLLPDMLENLIVHDVSLFPMTYVILGRGSDMDLQELL